VTVNVVAPGPIDTAFYRGAETPESVARATTASVAGRLGHIEDIVPLIEFLVSPQSQWVTAQTLFINGGYLAR
jgi:NAD(P)-dependent dehydrogenase (short-subunit alcohol dehydrogenase family)